MTQTHGRYGAPSVRARTQPRARRRAGFSLLELVISLALFSIIAGFVSVSVVRTFSAASEIKSRATGSALMADELNKLSSVSYANLVAGNFTVPDRCPATGAGISGDSCVSASTQKFRISYGYKTGADVGDCTTTDTARYSAGAGFVSVNACVTQRRGGRLHRRRVRAGGQHPGGQPPVQRPAGRVQGRGGLAVA